MKLKIFEKAIAVIKEVKKLDPEATFNLEYSVLTISFDLKDGKSNS